MKDPVSGAESAPSTPTFSRRRFLRIGCLSTAAVGLTVCGISSLVPAPPPIELSSVTAGRKRSSDRLLVAYASFAGSTLFLPNGLARLFPTLDFRDWDKIRSWARTLFTSESM
jgi:hypothetical protein